MAQPDFSKEKYEYMLQTWGGFYNDNFKAVHGREEGYVFFDTMAELQAHLAELQKLVTNEQYCILMHNIEEGQHVRYKTIARMKLVYKRKSYEYEYDFGYGYPPDMAHYMFHEGNYACDCNRSLFLRERYGDTFPELTCGDKITLEDFEVVQVKPFFSKQQKGITFYTPFDRGSINAFEMHGIEETAEDGCMQITDDTPPNFWSVYVHLVEGGVMCIADCETKQQASDLYDLLEAVTSRFTPLK